MRNCLSVSSTGCAEQLRQLAGRGAAHQIHLEETILRVREAGREREIARAKSRSDRRRALRVALDRRRCTQRRRTRTRRRAAAGSRAARDTQHASR